MARHFTVIRFDHRGSGLSTRDASSFSIEELCRDITAVIDKFSAGDLTVLAEADSGPIAIRLAVDNPGRIKHLVLWNTWARSQDASTYEEWQVLDQLASINQQLYLETIYGALVAGTDLSAREITRPMLSSVDKDTYKQAQLDAWGYDVGAVLGKVECATLVLHRENILFSQQATAALAAGIPNAVVQIVPGAGGLPWMGDFEPVARAIESFVLAVEEVGESTAPNAHAFRAVLFTDLVGHTEMMSRLGDERGRAVLREHETITRNVLKDHGGTEIKTMGDGFMASFGSVTKAVECAIAFQRAFEDRNNAGSARPEELVEPALSAEQPKGRAADGRPEPLHVRVGLNAGEPIEEDGDLFGATVILASRIAAKADAGEILVADTIRGLCSGKGFLFADRGDFVAKGFEEPVRVYEVSWRG
jgi:class 3 adenylate cyclase/pimeloyl-ACP methyl ester carboxylesterase